MLMFGDHVYMFLRHPGNEQSDGQRNMLVLPLPLESEPRGVKRQSRFTCGHILVIHLGQA